ncbi:hypothetical protein [Hydrogenimonas sp. SS33]|uniref:hypothetical protein n=1 Tax=Hydrogenimonas leucolamina TaxID=2954236 RepID=UPI00336C28F5
MREMKVALHCHSALLEKSLAKFLDGHLCEEDEADIVICDHPLESLKPVFRIGNESEADLKKPFSRSQLMIKLEERLKQLGQKKEIEKFVIEENESLEEKIGKATENFVKELVLLIREHYETKR